MPGIDSEAFDFRAASELFAPLGNLVRHELETLRLVTEHQARKVPTIGGMLVFGKNRARHLSGTEVREIGMGPQDPQRWHFLAEKAPA